MFYTAKTDLITFSKIYFQSQVLVIFKQVFRETLNPMQLGRTDPTRKHRCKNN